MAPGSIWQDWSMGITRKFRNWAVIDGIHPVSLQDWKGTRKYQGRFFIAVAAIREALGMLFGADRTETQQDVKNST